MSFLSEARDAMHQQLLRNTLRINESGVATNADKDSRSSKAIALRLVQRLGVHAKGARLAANISGAQFEDICCEFLRLTFPRFSMLRPGAWHFYTTGHALPHFEQYEHLNALAALSSHQPQLAAAIGRDYFIKPDIIVGREPAQDELINMHGPLVDPEVACQTPIRKCNNPRLILHASISCKWTMRSDRAQNARTEALNLLRNRKGRAPHIVAVTAEPLPTRIASLALGTGDIDCVYHIALPELREAVASDPPLADQRDMLGVMIDGKRLRDIADLPLDLAV